MMRWGRVVAVAAVMALSGPQAVAHGRCWPRETIEREFTRMFGEIRQGAALPGSARPLELYVNPLTGSWTVFQSHMGALMCVSGTGEAVPPRRRRDGT